MTIHCDKCEQQVHGHAGHIGKRHHACPPRKKGSGMSYAKTGQWKAGAAPRPIPVD